MSVTADLSGPSSGLCAVNSTTFSITMSGTLLIDAVFTITSTVGGDTITTNPVTIPAGQTIGTFVVNPSTCGSRTITISSSTTGVIIGVGTSAYSGNCQCPDDTGATVVDYVYFTGTVVCPPTLSLSFNRTPFSTATNDMYCTLGAVTVVITE